MNVLWVSAIKIKKKKHSVWILAFCSSWLWDFSHCRLLLSLLRPQQPHSPWFDAWLSTGWTRVRRRDRTSATGWKSSALICALSEPFWKVPSQDLEVLSCAQSWLVISSKWLVKLWNNRFPTLPDFSVQISWKSLSYVHWASRWRSCNKVPQFAGDIFFFFVIFFFLEKPQ